MPRNDHSNSRKHTEGFDRRPQAQFLEAPAARAESELPAPAGLHDPVVLAAYNPLPPTEAAAQRQIAQQYLLVIRAALDETMSAARFQQVVSNFGTATANLVSNTLPRAAANDPAARLALFECVLRTVTMPDASNAGVALPLGAVQMMGGKWVAITCFTLGYLSLSLNHPATAVNRGRLQLNPSP